MVSNSQYNQIMREYTNTQAQHRAELSRRIEEVYAAIPELKELEAGTGRSALARYRAYASGDEKAIENFDKEVSEAAARKAELLKVHGYAPDYLEMQYTCPDCKDTGYTDENVKCHCLREKEQRLLYAQSNLEIILKRENFDTLRTDLYNDTEVIEKLGMTQKAYMEKIINLCKSSEGNILFTGSTGTGKTFLSNCIADRMIKEHHSVIYLTAIELFDVVADVRLNRSDDISREALYERILDCELLIIDDLGSELVNTMTNSGLFYILNHRLLAGLKTIISTNLSMNMIRDVYSERVSSRIRAEFDIIPLYGDDLRIK